MLLIPWKRVERKMKYLKQKMPFHQFDKLKKLLGNDSKFYQAFKKKILNCALQGLYLSISRKKLNIKNDYDDDDIVIRLSYF